MGAKKKKATADLDFQLEEVKEHKKRNIVIYSLSGASFTVDSNNLSDDKITEEHILKNIFKGKDISEISYSTITDKTFKDLDGRLTEPIRVYFSSNTTDIWNYNPIMSVFIGDLIYSSVLVFVSEYEMEGSDSNETPMDYDFFVSIVTGFIQTCSQYAYSSQEDDSKKREVQKSPMFKLSKIQFVMSLLPGAREVAEVRPGKDKSRLDTYWREKYVGMYIPDFVFNDLLFYDDEVKDYVKGHVMMKPGMMTIYSSDTGKAKLFMMQTTLSEFKKMSNDLDEEIEDLGENPKKEDIDKAKEKIMKRLYS